LVQNDFSNTCFPKRVIQKPSVQLSWGLNLVTYIYFSKKRKGSKNQIRFVVLKTHEVKETQSNSRALAMALRFIPLSSSKFGPKKDPHIDRGKIYPQVNKMTSFRH